MAKQNRKTAVVATVTAPVDTAPVDTAPVDTAPTAPVGTAPTAPVGTAPVGFSPSDPDKDAISAELLKPAVQRALEFIACSNTVRLSFVTLTRDTLENCQLFCATLTADWGRLEKTLRDGRMSEFCKQANRAVKNRASGLVCGWAFGQKKGVLSCTALTDKEMTERGDKENKEPATKTDEDKAAEDKATAELNAGTAAAELATQAMKASAEALTAMTTLRDQALAERDSARSQLSQLRKDNAAILAERDAALTTLAAMERRALRAESLLQGESAVPVSDEFRGLRSIADHAAIAESLAA